LVHYRLHAPGTYARGGGGPLGRQARKIESSVASRATKEMPYREISIPPPSSPATRLGVNLSTYHINLSYMIYIHIIYVAATYMSPKLSIQRPLPIEPF
jgi:hypothetical protein